MEDWMREKPVVGVSRCLGFEACRHDGRMIPDGFVDALRPFVTFVPVCPETEIGLGVPRNPIRMMRSGTRDVLFQPATGLDITEKMLLFTDQFLSGFGPVDGFILKSGSPSCGIGDEKTGPGNKGPENKGMSIFGGAVCLRFGGCAIADDARLKNSGIRDHFLVRLYAIHRFRKVKSAHRMGDLVTYHSRYKLLLMACNQTGYRMAGKVVANHDRLPTSEVLATYEGMLQAILEKPADRTALVDALQHAFGWISKNLTSDEKRFFLDTLEAFRCGCVPVSEVTRIIREHAERFRNDCLKNQALLDPYPAGILCQPDTGRNGKSGKQGAWNGNRGPV